MGATGGLTSDMPPSTPPPQPGYSPGLGMEMGLSNLAFPRLNLSSVRSWDSEEVELRSKWVEDDSWWGVLRCQQKKEF